MMRVQRIVRTLWPMVLGLVLWGASACGLGTSPQGNGRPQPHPLVTVNRTNRLFPLKPTTISVEKLTGAQSSAVAHADLTGSGQIDSLALTARANGQSHLAVTGPSGRPLLSKPSVSSVTILQFGPTHLPVILLQGGLNFCGSGGCQYQGYTWSRVQRQFVPVGNPTSPAFRYDAKSKTFRAIHVSLPNIDGLFGFISVHGRQLELLERTYDLWQHAMIQPLRYAPQGSRGGRWVVAGPVQYQPGGSEPNLPFNTPAELWTAFLEARALNLPLQAKPLIVPASQKKIWNTFAPLTRLGVSLTVDTTSPKPVIQGDHADVSVMVSGVLHPDSPDAQMVSYWAGAEVFSVAGTGLIGHASLDPVHLKVSTVYAVLRRIRRNPILQHALSKHAKAVLLVSPAGSVWDVSLNQGSPILSVNAKTGAVQSRGS